ncbi:MAG TPA: lipopolysaccharide transport periplasmic protein LptA [Desulfuromonadaceae bacterium]
MRLFLQLVLLVSVASFFASSAQAGSPVRKDRSSQPITIKSNELSADNKGKTALFAGKVVAKQSDITIYSDKLTVNYADEKNDVEKIEAVGNVRIVQENRIATAGHAIYDSKLGRITLTGNPKVTEGAANTISGSTIIYYLDEERSEVRSEGKDRVVTTIQPRARKK